VIGGRLGVACVLAAVALSLACASAGASAAVGKACGTLKVKTSYGSTLGGPIRASRITCARAKQVIRYAFKHPDGNSYRGPAGWSCARGGSPAVSGVALECSRGRARALVVNRR
jgi:hypothetical protein